jgi:exportin-1
MDAAAAHLLDFSKPFDCALLDQIVLIVMDGSHPQRQAANEFLVRIKDHPDMWKRVDAILESSTQVFTKMFALQVLSDTIETRWKVISTEQREGIRNYIVGKIISISTNAEMMKTEHVFLSRLNLVLVQILKQDWPANWPTFIHDLVMSSKSSESLCENNMYILKLLSEEVFDYSKDTMTSAKAKTLKESLNEEFAQIFQLCEFILEASTRKSLILSTLATLQRFLSWIPLGYIFETGLVAALLSKFFPDPTYRVAALDCLTEIASLPLAEIPNDYRMLLIGLLGTFIQQLQPILPIDVDLKEAYEASSEEDRLFIQRLALFLGSFLKSFLTIFEDPASDSILHPSVIISALRYMILVSTVRDEEVFKTCLEFWPEFAKHLYTKVNAYNEKASMAQAYAFASLSSTSTQANSSPYAIFDLTLHDLRIVLIDHMAKPEEVIIIEDENGDIVREQTKDTEVIAQYNTMHETLVYLTNLNSDDTQAIMLDKLDMQVSGGHFSWNGLNTLCWAIGSVSGAMAESEEKRFLVSVIKDLLRLCEEVRGKDNKAVVASNIMYIVGQYPRFLKAHWKFLKTVVNKLFEFMHEYHPGVQDMACDTFLKIASKCKRKFMTLQFEEAQPFIITLINDLSKHLVDLQPHQVQVFYESVATMLSDYGPEITIPRSEVFLRFLDPINQSWKQILAAAGQDVQVLFNLESIRELQRILKLCTRVCAAVGTLFIHELSLIYLDAIQIYKFYSEHLIKVVQSDGAIATKWTMNKAIRYTKSEFLDMMKCYFEELHKVSPAAVWEVTANTIANANGATVNVSYTLFMPELLNTILLDYKLSPPSTRDAKILSLFAVAVQTFHSEAISSEIPRIMDAIFEPTLELITTNMSDHPDHRINFFQFLRNANQYCFYGLFSIPASHQKLIIDSILWAMKHTDRNVSEMGLETLHELLQNVSNNPMNIRDGFYAQFILLIFHEVFSILTDRLHKSGFKLQVMILKHLFDSITLHGINQPLVSEATPPPPSSSANLADYNRTLIYEKISSLLAEAFPNLSKSHINEFLAACFDVKKDLESYKQSVRDFLVCCKEFELEDNSDLYLDEKEVMEKLMKEEQYQYRASVPGLLKPDELDKLNGVSSSHSRGLYNADEYEEAKGSRLIH